MSCLTIARRRHAASTTKQSYFQLWRISWNLVHKMSLLPVLPLSLPTSSPLSSFLKLKRLSSLIYTNLTGKYPSRRHAPKLHNASCTKPDYLYSLVFVSCFRDPHLRYQAAGRTRTRERVAVTASEDAEIIVQVGPVLVR